MTNKTDWDQLVQSNKLDADRYTWPGEDFEGCCVHITEASANVVAVLVCNRKSAFETILHECVHVWQALVEYIEESNPGIETEAYTIEHITVTLMGEYERLTGEALAVPNKRKKRLQKGIGVGTSPSSEDKTKGREKSSTTPV